MVKENRIDFHKLNEMQGRLLFYAFRRIFNLKLCFLGVLSIGLHGAAKLSSSLIECKRIPLIVDMLSPAKRSFPSTTVSTPH